MWFKNGSYEHLSANTLNKKKKNPIIVIYLLYVAFLLEEIVQAV